MGLLALVLQLKSQARADGDKVPALTELAGNYTYAGDRAKDERARSQRVIKSPRRSTTSSRLLAAKSLSSEAITS